MKKLLKKITAVLMAVLMTLSFAAMPMSASASDLLPKATSATKPEIAEGEAIVVFKDREAKTSLNAGKVSEMFGKKVQLKNVYSFADLSGKGNGTMNVAVLKSSRLTTRQLIRKAKKNPDVKYAFPNTRKHATGITKDAFSDFQWALSNQGQNGGTAGLDVNAENLWSKAEKSKKDQIVAVVDTGIDYNNPEFKGILWENKHGSKLLGKYGYDFSGDIKDHSPLDNNGHGTHCAGIIAAAANNNRGVSGISQSHTKIMPVKWLDADGSGWTEGVLAAYEYINRAIALGENVVAVSNSWGGLGALEEINTFNDIFDQFGEAGVISLVAAGNETQDITKPQHEEFLGIIFEEEYYVVPAACNSPYQLTVAATDEKDELADFSNYGVGLTDVAAPGVNILSTVSYPCFNPTIYSAAKRSKLVAQMQDYNGALSTGDFGYPKVITPKQNYFIKDFSPNAKIGQSDRYFGTQKGKSLSVVFKDKVAKDEAELYCFTIPFTLEDEKKNYSISMMTSGVKGSYGLVFDVPATFDFEKGFDLLFNGMPVAEVGGSDTGNYWSHSSYNVDVSASGYKKAKERQLVFVIEAYAKNTEFNIDDLAISKSGVDQKDFLYYDFYSGTSMATPYVAGAVALLKNAYPKASTLDVVNMIKNTGRVSEALKGKTDNARVLSLDNLAATPPMIADVAYNSKGNIEIKGSFRKTKTVKINGKTVKPKVSKSNKIVVKDNKYNTRKLRVEVSNTYGSDQFTSLVSKKKALPLATDVITVPDAVTDTDFFLPAGDTTYYVSEYGALGKLYKDKDADMYAYSMLDYVIDPTVLFEVGAYEEVTMTISSAVYANGNIYFIALRPIYTASTGTVIGYENAFGKFRPSTGTTTKICEVPDDALFGSSLGAYNGKIYLAGGYDSTTGTFSNAVYQYNAKKKAFVKTKAALPEGRAYTRFLQYGNRLVGAFGAQKNGKMPAIVTFDGKTWTASKVKVKTEDYTEMLDDIGNTVKLYQGSFGLAKKGLLLSGVYLYGYGDTYYYNPASDKLIKSKFSTRNSLEEPRLIGTSLPGRFIAFPAAANVEIEDIDGYKYKNDADTDETETTGEDDSEETYYGEDDYLPTAYTMPIGNGYAKVDTSAIKHATVTTRLKKNYVYGEKITLTLEPDEGYRVVSISQGKTVRSQKSNSAKILINAKRVKVTAKVTKAKK